MLSFVFLFRIWQAFAGIVTTILVVGCLSLEYQGWYYSFISVAALYTLFDLGLSTVLVQISAHESTSLRWGKYYSFIGVSSQSFSGLTISAFRIYLFLGVLFILFVLPGGYIFFSTRSDIFSHWHSAWIVLCVVTASSLVTVPVFSILEGAGQIEAVYRLRFTQAALGSLSCWLMLVTGAQLWATVMVPLFAVVTSLTWIFIRARGFLAIIRKQRFSEYEWRREVWPLQWRMAASWFSGYLITQINIPILFYIDGPILAGQFGLSLTIVNTLALVCQSWFIRHVPIMAKAVASKDWKLFDDVFSKDFIQSIIMFFLGAIFLLCAYVFLIDTSFVNRLLPFWPFVGLLMYAFVSLLVSAWATHLRSFRREPLLPVVLICTALILPGVLIATKFFSIYGMIFVLNFIYLLILLPFSWLIWRHSNNAWRKL